MLRRFVWLLAVSATALAGAQSRVSDVIYAKSGGAAFTYDVFRPEKPTGAAVIWLVSGGWVSRHEDINPGLATMFNDRGVTVFEVVHGAQPKYTIPEIIVQVRRAVRTIHATASTYGVDPNRIGISGGSAGGHLSLMIAATGDAGDATATDSVDRAASSVNAVGVFFPPTDMENFGADGTLAIDIPMLKVFWPAFGVTAATPRDAILKMGHDLSPMTYVTAKMPPTLLIHGDKDPLVPIQQSYRLDKKLGELGVDHQLIVVPGGVHGGLTIAPEQIAKLIAWFEKKLGGS